MAVTGKSLRAYLVWSRGIPRDQLPDAHRIDAQLRDYGFFWHLGLNVLDNEDRYTMTDDLEPEKLQEFFG